MKKPAAPSREMQIAAAAGTLAGLDAQLAIAANAITDARNRCDRLIAEYPKLIRAKDAKLIAEMLTNLQSTASKLRDTRAAVMEAKAHVGAA